MHCNCARCVTGIAMHWWALHLLREIFGSISNLSFLPKPLERRFELQFWPKLLTSFLSILLSSDWRSDNLQHLQEDHWSPLNQQMQGDDMHCRALIAQLSIAATLTYNWVCAADLWCFLLHCLGGKEHCAQNHPAGKRGQHQKHWSTLWKRQKSNTLKNLN